MTFVPRGVPQHVRALAFLAFGLAACGKRGHLEPPPAENGAPQEKASQTKLGGAKRAPIKAPKRDLPIDWILD